MNPESDDPFVYFDAGQKAEMRGDFEQAQTWMELAATHALTPQGAQALRERAAVDGQKARDTLYLRG